MCDNDNRPNHAPTGPGGSPPAATDALGRKRDQLVAFIDRKMAPHAAVQAIVAFGSVATGTARPDSDIDAYVFMEPLDAYLVPAESVWRERDDTFHSIFSDDSSLGEDGVQLDFHRVDLAVWREPDFAWPEHARAELADGWVAFDRHGAVAPLVTARTTYPDDARLHAIDEAVTFVAANSPTKTMHRRPGRRSTPSSSAMGCRPHTITWYEHCSPTTGDGFRGAIGSCARCCGCRGYRPTSNTT